MKVNINELQKITNLLLEKLQQSKGNEIELNSDYYWDIAIDEIYNPYNEPTTITLGQISDDLTEINRLLHSDDDIIPYDLKRLASVINALSLENQTAF